MLLLLLGKNRIMNNFRRGWKGSGFIYLQIWILEYYVIMDQFHRCLAGEGWGGVGWGIAESHVIWIIESLTIRLLGFYCNYLHCLKRGGGEWQTEINTHPSILRLEYYVFRFAFNTHAQCPISSVLKGDTSRPYLEY